jgi:hypothetical protein
MGAMDCGGTGHSCCFSTMTFSTSCVMGACPMGQYTQCVSSDTECPSGLHCVMSPLGMSVHYCGMGEGGLGGGTDGGGGGDAGGSGDGSSSGDGATE